MTASAFLPVGSSGLYEVPAAGGRGWAGYLLPEGAIPGTEPIPFEESLTGDPYPGHYLFALERPAELAGDPDRFVKTLYAALDALTSDSTVFVGRAIAWLQQNEQSEFTAFGFFSRFLLLPLQGWNVVNNANLELGARFSFFVNVGATVGLSDAVPGLRLSSSNFPCVGFTPSDATPAGLALKGSNKWWVDIPLTGGHTGCFVMEAALDVDAALPFFEIGLQYVHVAAPPADAPVRLVYPLLSPSGEVRALFGSLDPLDPLNAALSATDLTEGLIRSGFFFADTAPLASALRTPEGKAVALVARAGDGWFAAHAGGLVFAAQPPQPGSGQVDYQLAPAGDYAMAVAGVTPGTSGQRLLPGLFGTEFITFTTAPEDGKGDWLRWYANQDAYASIYPFAASSLDHPASGAIVPSRLGPAYKTSWAAVVLEPGSDVPASYSAQPAGAPLYASHGAVPEGMPTGTPLLGSTPPIAAFPVEVGFCVPLAPYAGLPPATDGADAGRFESQILSATRKALISLHTQAALRAHKAAVMAGRIDALTRSATTPQGLLAQVPATGHGCYQKVTMAVPQSPSAPDFAFCNLAAALTDALQTNQLFLVAVSDKALGEPVNWTPGEPKPDCCPGGAAQFLNTIDIADWTFIANVGSNSLPTRYRNVLILKFCDGPLAERLKNPNQWTQPEDFSQLDGTAASLGPLALTGLSSWLQEFVQDGIDKSEGDGASAPLYENFARMVQDPNWNGFVVLNADLPLSALPAQIAGIGAGIDLERFVGHHFGSTVSRIKRQADGSLAVDGVSSLFGLIDYADPTYERAVASGVDPDSPVLIPTTDGYGFSVLELQVLFAQAKLKTFHSRIQLSLDAIFGSAITRTSFDGRPQHLPALVLDGAAITQNDRIVYVFEQARPYVFVPDTPALNTVSVTRVQFNTLSVDSAGKVDSRFLFWGALDFAVLHAAGGVATSPFDILSFGSESAAGAQAGSGLRFSNLQIRMDYVKATPSVVGYAFSPENLAFDANASVARGTSLYTGFALQVTGFIAAPSGKAPADYGFLPVVPQDLPLDKLQGPWFGIVYKIEMGTPGSLVAAAGFSSSFVTAWAPAARRSDARPQVFAGLCLPGAAPGASAFSLQGVVKLSTGPIKLNYAKGADDPAGPNYYSLRLENIGIQLLGFLKLPPAATIQFFLFGDPKGSGSLGWWASYIQDDAGQSLARLEREPTP